MMRISWRAFGAAVRQQQAIGIQLKRINANCFQESAGFASFPEHRRAAATALHKKQLRVKTRGRRREALAGFSQTLLRLWQQNTVSM